MATANSDKNTAAIVTAIVAIVALLIIAYVIVEAMQPNYGSGTPGYGSSSYSDTYGDGGMVSSSFDTTTSVGVTY